MRGVAIMSLDSQFTHLNKRLGYLVGVSGGRDSMVLIDMLTKAGFRQLAICHLNHGLRGRSSAADAGFVRGFAKKAGIPFYSAKADTRRFARDRGLSLETAARELRYSFFSECARKAKCRRLILAHHAGDQAETVLFHFMRGSGAQGLGGMRPVSSRQTHGARLCIFRPLLDMPRADIETYSVENRIRWREDLSNQSPDFTRNRIRHEVLPLLNAVAGRDCLAPILRAAMIFQAEEDWMASLTPAVNQRLHCAKLAGYPLALQRRIVRRWLLEQHVPEPGFDDVEAVLSLLDAAKGPSKINLPAGMHARRRQGEIFLE